MKNGVADSKLDLATVAIEEGRFAEAESLARQTIVTYREFKEPDSLAAVHVVLARALAGQGKAAAAQEALRIAADNARSTQDQMVRGALATTTARLQAGAKNPAARAKSIEELNKLIADVTPMGLTEVQLDARLALGELEKADNRSASMARLAAVQKEAAARGFGLIDRRAAAAMK